MINKLEQVGYLWLVNEKKDDGFSPLHLACLNSHFEAVKLLVLNGNAKLDARNVHKQTALHLAIEKRNFPIVKLLILKNCNLNAEDRDGDTPLHYIIRQYTLIQLKEFNKLPKNFFMTFLDIDNEDCDGSKKLCINIAGNLIQSGADLYAKNKRDQSPLDLCQDENVHKLLTRIYMENFKNTLKVNSNDKGSQSSSKSPSPNKNINKRKSSFYFPMTMSRAFGTSPSHDRSRDTNDELTDANDDDSTCLDDKSSLADELAESQSVESLFENLVFIKSKQKLLDECTICSFNTRDILFKPCNHVLTCQTCSLSCQSCQMCHMEIEDKIPIEYCILCTDQKASVLFQPCGHLNTCELCSEDQRKCGECNALVRAHVPLIELCGIKVPKEMGLMNNGTKDPFNAAHDAHVDVKRLQLQYKSLREQTMCPVCMEKIKNMVFLCGHGTCQMCGDRLFECPICRKGIQRRILLY